MSINHARQIIPLLQKPKWSFFLREISRTIERLGFQKTEEVIHEQGNRFDFRVVNNVMGSVYYCQEKVVLFEIVLEFFADSSELDDLEYEDKVDEYYNKFNETVDIATSILGVPEFCNGAAARGFPSDQEADWIALWK